MRVLFVTHRWRHARPGTGDSVTLRHLLHTFGEYDGDGRAVLNDVAAMNGQDPLRLIAETQAEFRAEVVLYTPIPHPQIGAFNISPEAMRVAGTQTASVFFDLARPDARAMSSVYATASDLSISVDGSGQAIGSKCLHLWAPCVTRRPTPKDIPVSFVGSTDAYPERAEVLDYLQKHGIDIFRPSSFIEFSEYDAIMDRSRVVLNFSHNFGGVHQIKARVFEAIASGCCLVENANPVTPRFFEPGREVIHWNSLDELADILRRFMAYPDEAATIARRASARFQSSYSARHFWGAVEQALFGEDITDTSALPSTPRG